jgi:hypothetical protein
VIEGLVAAVAPSTSHNVFVNALVVGPPAERLRVRITELSYDPAAGELTIAWESKPGRLYNLRSETDLSIAPVTAWPIFDANENLAGTPPENSLTFAPPADADSFFVVEEFPPPPVAIFSEDFESGQGGWTAGSDGDPGTDWQLGTPSAFGPLAAYSPLNCFGTNIAADYAPGAVAWLRSPAIDLTAVTEATVHWYQFVDIEPLFDLGTVSVLDASDDTVLAVLDTPIDGLAVDWSLQSEILPAAALGQTIKIEFRFESDSIMNFAGWYIDDVVVTVPGTVP